MATAVRINFLLRGVDVKALLELYNSGKLDNITIAKDKVSISEYKNPTTKVYSQDYKSASFCRKDKTGNTLYYETTFCNTPSTCFWCRAPLNKDKMVGLPIMVSSENTYFTDGAFCDNKYRCCYAYYQNNSRDPLYRDSETILKLIYALEYGNERLIPAPDWRLHERNGGSLKDKDFQEEKGKFNRTANFIPVRVEYRSEKA